MPPPARLLVIDDSPTIRRVVERALTDSGYAVAVADGGEQGLSEARAMRPDLILLDFVMPGMNGYQVVKAIAEDPSIDETPIILLCTRTDQVPEDALKGLGVVDICTKPFSPEELVERVGQVLETHGSRAREETAPIVGLPSDLERLAQTHTLTTPEAAPEPEEGAESALDHDLAAAAALADLTRVLADALFARGIDDADHLAEAICNQVRSGLSSALLRAFVSHELGVDVLRRPVPSLYGDLHTVPLPEVLQLLKFQGQTGVLEVSLDRARYEVGFRRGHIVSIRARNVTASLRLGRYFLEQGALTEEELEASAQRRDERPLGQRLLEEGAIDPKQLEQALRAQAHDLMFDLLRATEGVFGLRSGESALSLAPHSPGFSVDELLFEALRRVDEATVFKKEVPSLEARFVRGADATEDGLTAEEIAVFRLLGDPGAPRSARELMDQVRVPDHQIEKILYRLVVLGRASRVSAR